MREYAIKRLLLFFPTLILATMLVFALFHVVPGDVAYLILGGGDEDDGAAVSLVQLEELRHDLGLDRPIYVQYGTWLWDAVRGDLGTSIWYKTPIRPELQKRFVVTIELAIITIVMAVSVAIPLGVISAVKQDTPTDYGSRLLTLIGIALPNFWLGILTIYGLAYFFNWLPPIRYAALWDDPISNIQQMIFPALVLATADLAFLGRVTRSSMLEVLREDYIRTARAKGLKELSVLGQHALKNAVLPVVTISGSQFGRLLGGTIIVETIFVMPGMGALLVESISTRDIPVLQAVVMIIAVVVLVVNLVVDLSYAWLDPRIRYG